MKWSPKSQKPTISGRASKSVINQPWQVHNPPAINVSSKLAVVTIAVGDKLRWMFDITIPSQKAYCEKHGLLHIEINDEWRNDEHPCVLKQHVYYLLKSGRIKRACFADGDMLFNLHAPNIFEEVPEGMLGVYEEGHHWRNPIQGDLFLDFLDYCKHYNEEMRKIGEAPVHFKNWDRNYYNAGFFVCDVNTCPHLPPVGNVMNLPSREILHRGGDFYDQHYFNLMRIKHNIPVHELHEKWDLFRGRAKTDEEIKSAYFIHYCGTDPYKEKLKTDFPKLEKPKPSIPKNITIVPSLFKEKRRIVTMMVGDKYKKIGEVTMPFLERLAKAWNVPLTVLAQNNKFKEPAHGKVEIVPFLEEGERVCFIDLDTLPNVHTPNLFELVRPGTLGLVERGQFWDSRSSCYPYTIFENYKRFYEQKYVPDKLDIQGYNGRYYNTGVFVCDLASFPLTYDPIPTLGFMWEFYEQTWFNIQVHMKQIHVTELPLEFNFVEGAKKHTGVEDILTSAYIPHYTETKDLKFLQKEAERAKQWL